MLIDSCFCCGDRRFLSREILWPDLIDEWRLSPAEAAMINRQQGTVCVGCGANLRSIALALAITRTFGHEKTLAEWVTSIDATKLSVLELNAAGSLTPWLQRLPGHIEAHYPDVDMQSMPFASGSFDLVLHSDTLEHVPDPVRGLAECRRVLRTGGACCFTVPMVIGRLTLSREGLPPSFHGTANRQLTDYLVYTEYGADTWRHAMEAGFGEVRLVKAEFPAAIALAAIR